MNVNPQAKQKRPLFPAKLLAAVIAACSFSQQSLAGCTYTVNSQWNGGFNATIKVTNTGTTTANGWNVSWQYTGVDRATSAWNATLAGANPYTASATSWSQSIAPGQFIEFGIQGTKQSAAAQIPAVTGALCDTVTPTVAPVLYAPPKAPSTTSTAQLAPQSTDHLGQGAVARFGQFALVGGVEGDAYAKFDDLGLVQLYNAGSVNAVATYRLSPGHIQKSLIKQALNFGRAVALDQNWLMASATNFIVEPVAPVTSFADGAVFYAKKSTTGYNAVLEEKIIMPPLMANNEYPRGFGRTLSLGQNILLVGSSEHVHLYRYNSATDTWDHVFNIPLNAPEGSSLSTDSGKYAALSPDAKTVVIAAGGSARFYERPTVDSNTWVQVSEYIPQQTVRGAREYMTVDLGNAEAIVGYGKNISIIQRVSPATWGIRFEAIEVLDAKNPSSAVAISGTRALASKEGLTSVMELVNGIWTMKQQFNYPNIDLGHRVAIDGDNILLSARGYDGCAEGSTTKLVNTGGALGLTMPNITNLGALNLGCNRIVNPAFNTGLTGWNALKTANGATGTQSHLTGELRVSVTNAGTQPWHVQSTQNLNNITAGGYTINFKARASSTRTMVVTLGQALGTTPAVFCSTTINLTSAMKHFIVNCPTVPAEANARLDFNVGAAGNNTVVIDDVSVANNELFEPSAKLGFLVNHANNGTTCVGSDNVQAQDPVIAVPCTKTNMNQFVFNGDLITRPSGHRLAEAASGGVVAELILNRGALDPVTGEAVEAQAPAPWWKEDRGGGRFVIHPGTFNTNTTRCVELTAGSSVRVGTCVAGAKNQEWSIK